MVCLMCVIMRKKIISLHEGFSLLELIIAISIFSFVVIGAIDIMIGVFRAQAKAIAIKEVMDNARFTMELMTRELRTSTNMSFKTISSSNPPPFGCPDGLEFTSANQGSLQERFYYWDGTAIWRVAMQSAGSVDCDPMGNFVQKFTVPEVVVDHWGAHVHGSTIGPSDGQPFITLHLVMHSADPQWGPETTVDLQTTVVQRNRDE